MNNRKKIGKALKQAGYEAKIVEFIRCREYVYGDCGDSSYWIAETVCGEQFTSDMGDTVNEGVEAMIEDIFQRKHEE